jgi:diaminopimelate decarboxylase
MLFMVIERFKPGAVQRIGERFRQHGRMLPEGVAYQVSWVDAVGGQCFQVMEAPNSESLSAWANRWNDLVDFEIVPVLTSGDFWAQQP